MNRAFGRFGTISDTVWSVARQAAMANPVTMVPAAASYALDASNAAFQAGVTAGAPFRAAAKSWWTGETPVPAGSAPITPEAQQLLERRLADYQTAPFREEPPAWAPYVQAGAAALVGLVALRYLLTMPAAPRRRRARSRRR